MTPRSTDCSTGGASACAILRDRSRAGHLLARLKLGSAHVVDAFVVATALQFDSAIIATGDPDEIRRLGSPFRKVRVSPSGIPHLPTRMGYAKPLKTMALHLIGAGLGRTGTLSLKAALERVGYGPCYHMIEVLTAPERGRHWLEPGPGGSRDWDAIFAGYRATVDWPAAAFWRELVERYPDAKVLLSLRDADRWYESVMNTIHPAMMRELPSDAPASLRDFRAMVYTLIVERTFGGRLEDRAHAKRVFEEHNQAVIDAVPASRLLVYRPGDGWAPLCRFLGVPVPDEDFPHLNDTAWYRARTGLDDRRDGE
jgi:hypothetical protein